MLPLLFALGCAYKLGPPAVSYADDVVALPLVSPSTDTRRWYVPLHAGDAGEWLVFVDTGYSYTTCDDDFVAALQTGTRGRRTVRGELGSIDTSKALLPPLDLGGHRLEGLVCLVRDLDATSSIADPPEVPVAAVLGIDALRPFRVTLDPSVGEVRLEDPADAAPLPDTHVVPMRREGTGTRVRIPVMLDGIEARPVLDTGAGGTYLDGERIGLAPTRTVEGVTVRGSGPGGTSTVDRTYFDIDVVELGGHRLDPVTVTSRAGPSGLLGLDILDQAVLTLDFERGMVHVAPAATTAPRPTWLDWRPSGAFDLTVSQPTP